MVPDFHSINIEKLPLSLVDDLTQLCNRRFIYNNMPQFITRDEASARKTFIFMIDVDNFKHTNDTFGHLVGDMVLMELARIMKKSVAENGIVARYAGDEFLILLPGQGEEQAHKIGEAILQGASEFKWSAKNKTFKGQGLSIGIAVYPDDNVSMIELINCADQALYAAKKSGKNKIFHYRSVSKEIKNSTIMQQRLLRPPLADRKEELDNIKEHYKIAESAKKHGILVEGESGIGKTRLLEEFASWIEKQNSFFLFCKLEQKEDSGPLAALTELLRLLAGSLGVDALRGVLAKLSPSELAEILSLYSPAKDLVKNASVKIEPERRAENLFSGLRKILVSAAGDKTLVLAVDDLHRANQVTLQFFSGLLGASDLAKFLFIGTYDKESGEKLNVLLTGNISTTVKIGPLVKDDINQLIVSIFPDIKLELKQVDNMFKVSKGNPLLLCEILKNLVEKGHIKYEDDVWKIKDIGIKDIPDSLSDAIKPALGDLDDETRELLSTMAVMGGKVELGILKDFSGFKEGYLMELLDRAIKAGIIKLPDSSYDSLSFRSESARKALADKVSVQKAGSIHHKLAGLIEQEYKDELPAQLDRLISHLDLAKEKERSLRYKNIGQKLNEEFFPPAVDRPVSVEEELEKPLSQASTKIVKDSVLALRAAIIGTLLYPIGNSMRVDLENKAYEMMLNILKNDPTLTISIIDGTVLVNGYAPKYLNIKDTIGFTLVSLMKDYGISSITFKRDLEREELACLLHYFANLEDESTQREGLVELLKKRGVSHIKIDQVRYEKLSKISKAIGAKGASRGTSSIIELPKDGLLDMSVEQYSDPKISGKLGLIAEALILGKNNEKVKNIVDKFSEDLNAANAEDRSAVAEGAVKLGESLLIYEKSDLLDTLIKAMLNRFDGAKQSKEFSKLCNGLQEMAVRLIDKRNFNQAGMIIDHFKAQAAVDSKRAPEQKKIVEDGLHKIAHPKVVEALISAFREKIKSDNPADITDFLGSLGEYSLDPMLNILTLQELHEKDPFELFVMRHSVAMILKQIGRPAIEALNRMLVTDKRSFVIKNIIEVFGYIGSKEFLPNLAPFIHADSIQVRMQCVGTLKKIGSIESLKILAEALKDTNEDIRQAASSAIAQLADESFIKELRPFLADKSTENIARITIQRIQITKKK
ncbi:MAG: diguanylate cyclase [Candidatus Omnitrophica bacterium]|nr:diguanylate cyclase [Candidatus Omnitrophota bacterium]